MTPPVRILDTRIDTVESTPGIAAQNICDPVNGLGPAYPRVLTVGQPVPADSTFCVVVSQVPSSATGLLLNVTATDSDGPGFVQLVTTGTPGATSNLNKAAGLTLANQSSLQLGEGGSFEPGTFSFAVMVLNQGSASHLVIDLVGSYISNA